MNCENKRLFFAIEMPEELRRRAASALPSVKGLKPVRAGQIHLTLLFLGDIPVEKLDAVKECADAVTFKPFELEMTGSGFFPNIRRPSVFWLGLAECTDLMNLQPQIQQGMKTLGLDFKENRFVPHITLARIKRRIARDDLDELQKAVEPLTASRFQVNAFHLLSSELAPSGAIHTIEASFKAGG